MPRQADPRQISLFDLPAKQAAHRQAHNSTWGEGLEYKGNRYAGPYDIHRMNDQPGRVCMNTFGGRLARRRKAGERITSDVIHECLVTSPKAYHAKYGVRRTWVVNEGQLRDMAEIYGASSPTNVEYDVFRSRLVSLAKRLDLSSEHILHASKFDQATWVSFYGGGRGRRVMVYEGDAYPEHDGKTFNSLSSFMRTIGRYDEVRTISRRTRHGWSLDDALANPVLPYDGRRGRIYIITQISTGLRYIGLTINPLNTRLEQHLNAAITSTSSRPILAAMRECGRDDFVIETIEDDIPIDDLPAREKTLIAAYGTMTPHGLNANKGGAQSKATPTVYEYEGERFRSKSHAVTILAERTGHTPSVVNRWLDEGKPLTNKARRTHHHPDAGSKMHRRWRGLVRGAQNGKRPGAVVPEWSDWEKGYDRFLQDVIPTHVEGYEIAIVDTSKPWGPSNFMWLPRGGKVALRVGMPITIGDRTFPSLSEAADENGIARSTLKYRLSRGMDPLEAATKPLGPTSRKRPGRQATVLDGKEFPSAHAAAIYGAETYGITYHMAKDRLARSLPMDHNAQARKPIEINGQHFESISAAVRHYGIPQVRFAGRRGKGWTIREALELDPRQKRSELT